MGSRRRKRQRAEREDDATAGTQQVARPAKEQRIDKVEKEAVDAELKSINALLQEEETSQKQTWQIGKRVKKLMESHPTLPRAKQLDAFFLWGTALARLASLNEDPTLAAAAADKFQQMQELSVQAEGSGEEEEEEEEEADAALGPVGYSLWASSLLIVATETQSREVLDQALVKFQKAVEVDGGTTFETRFQYAKALKEGGDLVAFLESESGGHAEREYYRKALEACGQLEEIYQVESTKEATGQSDEKHSESSDSDEEDVDEDDDKVTVEDFAEAKLLEAVLQGVLEDPSSSGNFHRTLALYQQSIALSPSSPEALMEMTNYLATRCLTKASMGPEPTAEQWTKLFEDLEMQYKKTLADAGFDLQECHEICHRKDTHDQEEPEEEEIDERVPHLLNALGKGLAAHVRSFPPSNEGGQDSKKQQKRKKKAVAGGARFIHAVEVLRAAHHFHDKLGGYHLACLYASPAFEDEEVRVSLCTADSYGALEDELDVAEFAAMKDKPWFQQLAQPTVQIEEAADDSEGEDA
ncbi:hypothetical protein BBJ28_00015682 [Nothophytophthora sp. Chile5]|nr:hypothetical protein BBJ28_00015682 [Nothophytophthora sp. Chile5]